MPRFVVYEVWTRSTVIEADDESDALAQHEPRPQGDLSLRNWHAVAVDPPRPTSGRRLQAVDPVQDRAG